MEIIKFDLNEEEKKHTGFSYYILGRSYDLEENGAEKDLTKAVEYYRKGLEIGDSLCIYSLGISYKYGMEDLLPVNEEIANILLADALPGIKRMIEDPNTPEVERIYAKFATGAYYYYGLGGIEKDYNKAFSIIKECAEKGHIAAIYDLGKTFYYNGEGTEKNLELAEYYLNLACSQDYPRALRLREERRNIKKK